jgi:hypothetical protein
MFNNIRRNRQTARLAYHVQRIDTSLRMRQRYITEGLHGMVLAVNYELASDATRAIDALRRIEELTPDHELAPGQRAEFGAMRSRLARLIDLPSLPAWRVAARSGDTGYVPPAEIAALYERFLSTRGDGP